MTMEIGCSVGPSFERVPQVPDRFDFVEVCIGEGEAPVGSIDVEARRTELTALDRDPVVHLPFRQPLATTVDRFDRANREYLASLLDVAAELGAGRAVVHVAGRANRVDQEAFAREQIAPQMEAVAAAGRERGVEVCFENVGNVGGTPLSTVGDLAERTDTSLCLDVGHAYAEVGQAETEAFAESYGDRVAHLHVHDVRDVGDSHIPIGSGDVEYEGIADALGGFDGSVTVELFGDDPDYAERSAEKFLAAF